MGNDVVKVCKVCGKGTKKMKRHTCKGMLRARKSLSLSLSSSSHPPARTKGCGAHSRDCWIILNKKTRQRIMSARRRSIIEATTTLTLRRNRDGSIGVEFNNDLIVTDVDPWALQFGVRKGQKVVNCCGIRVKTKADLIKVYKQHQKAGDPDVFVLTVFRGSAQASKTLMLRRGTNGKLGVNFDVNLNVVGVTAWSSQFGIRVGQRVTHCEGIPVKTKAEMIRVHNEHVTSDSEHADPNVFILTVIDPDTPLTATVIGELSPSPVVPTAQVMSVSTVDGSAVTLPISSPPAVPEDRQGGQNSNNNSFLSVSSFQSMQTQGSSVADMFGSALDMVVEENE